MTGTNTHLTPKFPANPPRFAFSQRQTDSKS